MKVKHLALFTVACNVVQFYFPFLHSSLILNLCQFCWCINTHSEKEIEVLKKSIFKLILNTFVKIHYQCFNVWDSYMWTQGHPHLALFMYFILCKLKLGRTWKIINSILAHITECLVVLITSNLVRLFFVRE